ncbi:MAG TPA: glycosyltransferase family 2 protein [Solirubrobacterales bacterium]
MAPALSYCIVNTNGREHLLACLDAIRETHPAKVEHEILVLDNASDDGSAAAVREWIGTRGGPRPIELIESEGRRGKAENDSVLLERARAPLCLLLNEDSELQPKAVDELLAAMRANPDAGAAGARLLSPDGSPQPCAWRLPGLLTLIAGVLFLHRLLTVESRGERVRRVGWVQSSAMLVRREAAAAVGYLDPEFFVYSDETDFCKRLRDAGWSTVFAPRAKAIHHEQLATDRSAGSRRVVEFHRNRDRYMRKHHRWLALPARPLSALPYLLRALAAGVLPGHDAGWYMLHARQAMRPGRGEGLAEAAAEWNRAARDASAAAP